MKILVTGGSGFLGKHVCRLLGADDFSRRSGFDVLNLQDVRRAADYDLVIHLAAMLDKSPEAADEVFLTNVEGTINLLREMREGATFVFASTKDVYGRFADNFPLVSENCPTLYSGQSALEWSKLIAEHYVDYYAREKRFRSCIFRLSTVYAPATPGNAPNFVTAYAEALNTGETLRLPANGRPRRDVLHVEDFARACRAFVDSGLNYGLYNLGGGLKNSLTLSELVERLEAVSGCQAVVDEENPLPAPAPFNYVTDLTRVSQELGWSPQTELDEGLRSLFI